MSIATATCPATSDVEVTQARASRLLDIDWRTTKRLVREGRLRSRISASGRVMIPLADVLSLVGRPPAD